MMNDLNEYLAVIWFWTFMAILLFCIIGGGHHFLMMLGLLK